MALARLDPVHEQAVGAVEVAERRQAVQADEQHRQQPRAGAGEQQQAAAAAHSLPSSSPSRAAGVRGDLAQGREDDHRHADAAHHQL